MFNKVQVSECFSAAEHFEKNGLILSCLRKKKKKNVYSVINDIDGTRHKLSSKKNISSCVKACCVPSLLDLIDRALNAMLSNLSELKSILRSFSKIFA